MLAICHFNIYSTEVAVMQKAGYVPGNLVPLPIRTFYRHPFYVLHVEVDLMRTDIFKLHIFHIKIYIEDLYRFHKNITINLLTWDSSS